MSSRLISDILQAPEPHFSHLIREWEALCEHPSHDVRLAIEINQSLKILLRKLMLDSADTHGPELYHALLHRVTEDNQRLAKFLNISDEDTVEVMIQKVVKFASRLELARPLWSIKPSVTKQYLRSNPPKRLMKLCGLRSIDSILKRHNPGELIALGLLVEPSEWATKFHNCYKKVKISDFDEESAEIVIVSSKHANALKKSGYSLNELVIPVRGLGVILVLPPPQRFEGDVLLLADLLIEALRERYVYSTFFRNLSALPKPGEKVAHTLQKGLHAASEEIIGTGWSVLHGVAAGNKQAKFQDFGPGLEFDDPSVAAVAEILGEHVPDFAIWKAHFIAQSTPDGPISCHLTDVIMNASGKVPYEKRIVAHVQASVWDELRIRYLSEESVARKVLKNDMIFQAQEL